MIPQLSPFYDAVENPAAVAARAKEQHRPVLGYLCSYAPEELIHAAGCHPLRLFSSKAEISLADNHLQAYCCSLVRGILEDGLAGRLDHLDGAVFPHTCDSIQRLSDIWRMNMNPAFFADVTMPAKLNTDSARQYMQSVLEKFKSDLETYTGSPITDRELRASNALFNRIRKGLSQIYGARSEHPELLSGKDLFTVVKGAMLMDRNRLADAVEDLVSALPGLREEKSVSDPAPARLILSGSVCDMPDLYTLIQEAGATVVGDDLCTGQRWFEGMIPEHLPPMAGLTSRYTHRVVCPAKHSGTTARGATLVDQVHTLKADGVIFIHLKFCDPHAFDYPYLKEFLDNEGIPSLRLEIDDQQINAGQAATRLETFIQMI